MLLSKGFNDLFAHFLSLGSTWQRWLPGRRWWICTDRGCPRVLPDCKLGWILRMMHDDLSKVLMKMLNGGFLWFAHPITEHDRHSWESLYCYPISVHFCDSRLNISTEPLISAHILFLDQVYNHCQKEISPKIQSVITEILEMAT